MPLKVIKTLNGNSSKCYGASRIIIGSFQHGFIELAHKGIFFIFLKPAIKTDVSFLPLWVSKWLITPQGKVMILITNGNGLYRNWCHECGEKFEILNIKWNMKSYTLEYDVISTKDFN